MATAAFAPLLNEKFINELYTDSFTRVKEDRMQFINVYDLVEEYCKKNKLIISSVYKLLDLSNTLDAIVDFDYKIYSSSPFVHANAIANALHEARTTTTQYIKLKTVRENREFTIEYDTRPLIKIYKLQGYHSREPFEIISPIEINELNYIPSEIEIIDIYHQLYRNQDYEKNMSVENLLFKQVSVRKEQGILGGRCPFKPNERGITFIKNKLFHEWILEDGRRDKILILGLWLYDLLSGKIVGNSGKNNTNCDALRETNYEKIQIMYAGKTAEEVLSEVRYFINSYLPASKVEMKEQELHIPKDLRTKRYTFYMDKKPFMDLFNNLEFEMIPYDVYKTDNKVKYLMAHNYVALRFLFVDLWVIRVIKSMNLLSNEVLVKKVAYLWEAILFLKDRATTQFENFLGIYIAGDISKKIANLKEKMFMPYYPEIYMREKGKYRII